METLVLIAMIIVCFNYLLKQTYRKWWEVAISTLFSAVFIGLMWRYAIQQSKTRISDWLSNQSLMLDMAVILSLDIISQFAFCLMTVRILSTEPLKPWQIFAYKSLRWFPGVLIYPVFFSFLVMLVFAFPGVSFTLISWGFGVALLILIPFLTFLLKKSVPEKDVRIELLFMTNIILAMSGIIATVNGRVAVEGGAQVEISSLIGVAALVVVFGAAGFFIRKLMINKKVKTLNRK